MNKYVPQEYFSVLYKKTGKKKCDCGWEMDAINMVAKNPEELTYIRSTNHLMGQVIDVTPPPALPTNAVEKYEHINDDPHDGWWLQPEWKDLDEGFAEDVKKSLPESDLQPVYFS